MRILICPASTVPFHGKTLLEKPLGGTETAVIHLAEALDSLGHEVLVLTSVVNPPFTKPLYIQHSHADKIGMVDVLLVVRGWHAAFLPIQAKKRFFWTGDAYTNPLSIGIGDKRFIQKVDGACFVSEWQRQTICRFSNFPLEKSHLLHNGVSLENFKGSEERKRHRLIYASNPQRGLMPLSLIFLKLKQKYPDLELHIFSNSALYDMSWPPKVSQDLAFEAILNIFKALPGCTVHGTVLQHHLAREMMKSAILAYPSCFEETSCIVAMEAQAAGCAVVTSTLGALPETVGNAGLLVRGDPTSEEYIQTFTDALDKVLGDDTLFHSLSNNGLERAKTFDWKLRAQEFLKAVESSS